MKYLVICLTFLFFIAYGQSSIDPDLWSYVPSDCGKRRTHINNRMEGEERLINGTDAKLGQFPWMARLGKTLENGKKFFLCGGSLVTRKFVITAAHCDEIANIVRLGQTFESEFQCEEEVCPPPFQDIGIKKYLFQDFCQLSLLNDVMLIEMEKPATLNEFVQPACLPPPSLSLQSLIGKHVLAAGFGQTNGSDENSDSPNLQFISVPIREPWKCELFNIIFDRKQQFCLSGYSGKSGCMGDSGSGIVVFPNTTNEKRGYLIGIISYGGASCHPRYDSVNVLVEYFLKWILELIKNNS